MSMDQPLVFDEPEIIGDPKFLLADGTKPISTGHCQAPKHPSVREAQHQRPQRQKCLPTRAIGHQLQPRPRRRERTGRS